MREIWQNLQIENLPEEIWKDIKGYEGKYQISNYGRVKSLTRKSKTKIVRNDRILKPHLSGGGYLQVKLCNGNKFYYPTIGKLVAEAFIKKPLYDCVINHIDCIRTNNRVDNLEWMSQSQNIRYAYELGRISQEGIKNNNAKVTEEKVKSIREFYKENPHLSQREIAEHFSLKREHIKDIISYKTWKHI